MKYEAILRFIKIFNIVLHTLAFGSCWFLFYTKILDPRFLFIRDVGVIVVFLLVYSFFCRLYDALLISYSRISEVAFSQGLSFLIADIVEYIILCLLAREFVNVLPMLVLLIVQILISTIWSYFSHIWYFNHFAGKRSIVVYDMETGMQDLIKEYGFDKKFDVQAIYTTEECISDISLLHDIEVVFLRGVHSKDRNIILKYCIEKGILVFSVPRVGDMLMRGAHVMHMFHLPVLRISRYNPPPEYLFAKRFFDILLSVIAIIIVSPIMLAAVIAIKRDGGPALYRQERLTKDGRVFRIFKFRTMCVGAENDSGIRLSTGEADERITKTGRFLRRYRIDELPQLFNIVEGSMCIVGPRPERPEIAAIYEEEMPEFHLRLQAKAGLTGYAQVYGKYSTAPYDKLLMDLLYISAPSLWTDFKICFATLKILFLAKSTEGVDDTILTTKGKK